MNIIIANQIRAIYSFAIKSKEFFDAKDYSNAFEQVRLVWQQGRRLEWRGLRQEHVEAAREISKKISAVRAAAAVLERYASVLEKLAEKKPDNELSRQITQKHIDSTTAAANKYYGIMLKEVQEAEKIAVRPFVQAIHANLSSVQPKWWVVAARQKKTITSEGEYRGNLSSYTDDWGVNPITTKVMNVLHHHRGLPSVKSLMHSGKDDRRLWKDVIGVYLSVNRNGEIEIGSYGSTIMDSERRDEQHLFYFVFDYIDEDHAQIIYDIFRTFAYHKAAIDWALKMWAGWKNDESPYALEPSFTYHAKHVFLVAENQLTGKAEILLDT